MKKTSKEALNYMISRASRKTGLSRKQVKEVFGSVADLSWDWERSKYDLYGLSIEETLTDFGEERKPNQGE